MRSRIGHAAIASGDKIASGAHRPVASTTCSANKDDRPGWVYEEKYDGWRMLFTFTKNRIKHPPLVYVR
jgi:ATP-dependent DNA ligase